MKTNNTTNTFSTHKGPKSTMKINATLLSLVAATAFGVMAVSAAHADINPVSPGIPTITQDLNDPFSTFSYPIVLTSTETLISGNYFTMFDVNGLVSGSEMAPTGFTASEALVGPVATGSFSSSPTTDNPNILNVTYTYSGPTVVGNPTALGNFSFKSIYSTATTRNAFSAVAEDTGSGTLNSNATSYIGPTASATTVPEPATVVPFLLGGLGLMALIVRKNRRASDVTA